MTDFGAAFRAGQEAATQAELARKDIDDVFSALNVQVAEITDGKIEIGRKRLERKKSSPAGVLVMSFGPRETYWAIVARNPKATDSNPRQIALWEPGRTGYPCKISWGGIDRTCYDRQSLEDSLSSLLGDAIVGETLRNVSNLPPTQETGESNIPTE